MSPLTHYIELQLFWALVGFAVGFITGATWRAIQEWRRERTLRPTISRGALGGFILLLTVIMVIQNYLYQRDRSDVTQCQAEYNLAVSVALSQRTEWAQEDRTSLNRLIFTIFRHPASDRKEFDAFRQYIATVKANNRLRAQNPLPPIPPGRCGVE